MHEPHRPHEDHDARLLAQVRPAGWVNPTPAGRYNLVVLGAGPAGLVAAAGAAGLGAKVALVERGRLGGDCLNVGCVPSKALLRAARAVHDVRRSNEFGIHVPDGVRVDFAAVMERVRRVRADLSPHDAAARFRDLGVDVFFGEGRFAGPDVIEVAGQPLRFHRAVIATGSRPQLPPIPGLVESNPLTNETIFDLTTLPPRLAVIGAGPIGCELAQAFARLGARVHLLDVQPRVLPRDDADAARLVAQSLERDGVTLMLGSTIEAVERQPGGRSIRLKGGAIVADEILVAAGRRPNVEGLNLDAAGIQAGPHGITVDDRLRTTNRRVYAAGDVGFPFQFTHAADATARLVLQNALFLGRSRASALTIPWCTYTDPEVAQVGLTEQAAREKGVSVRAFTQKFGDVDRAVLDGETAGFVKVLVREGSDRIVGATVVGPHAGDIIAALTLVMTGRLGLKALAATVFPYPTLAESVKKAGDAYNRTRFTPTLQWLAARWLAWSRR